MAQPSAGLPTFSLSKAPQPANLPARPTQPASSSIKAQNGPKSLSSAFTAFKPRTVVKQNTQPAPPFPGNSFQQQYNQTQAPAAQYQSNPQIHNPFPLPGQLGAGGGHIAAGYDPETEAQIAQWQSAYAGNESAKSATASAANSSTPINAPVQKQANKRDYDYSKPKTVVREGGGGSWQDDSLLEWDSRHFRLFVGNLAGETTDDSLYKAFMKYESIQKARVIRDRRTGKSKGFGFVSFSNGDQYFQAYKDMQGKYIGSHPVSLKRSTTDVKPVTRVDKNKPQKKTGKGGNANTGAGVKKQPKMKNGLKLLG